MIKKGPVEDSTIVNSQTQEKATVKQLVHTDVRSS